MDIKQKTILGVTSLVLPISTQALAQNVSQTQLQSPVGFDLRDTQVRRANTTVQKQVMALKQMMVENPEVLKIYEANPVQFLSQFGIDGMPALNILSNDGYTNINESSDCTITCKYSSMCLGSKRSDDSSEVNQDDEIRFYRGYDLLKRIR